MVKGYVPSQGDIVFVQLDPQVGKEQRGRRPAVVISPKSYNKKVGLSLMCPITSRVKGYPFEVVLPPNAKTHGVIMVDQIKSQDWKARNTRFVEKLSDEALNNVIYQLMVLIGRQ
ncbi:endoribonuclease MazF [Patescibacteria group bacterium]|nr:endoribonuclease MazF [Patescibacteria group bacterium]MBU1123106.1 endoribonuclease MazF [Patescibacteria group bacterium]MBU1911768.1 endoribonuclease MazF [Patescibacteria group bacterium]